jgi:tetratricopeptide (TPR) repeat protein
MNDLDRLPILAGVASLLLLCVPAPALAGNTGSLQVDVVDPNGAALAGATIVVTDPANASFRQEETTDRSGRASLVGMTPRALNFRVEKEGWQGYESNFMAAAGGTERRKVTLQPLGAQAGGGAGPAGDSADKKTEPWAVAYNEAVPLYHADRNEEAMAKVEASLKLKADYAPALALKGTIDAEHGKCDEAIPLLKQAYVLDPGARGALGPLITCLDKGGLKDEAASYRKLQAQAGRTVSDLYNEAVADINKGDDAAAAPLLEQALKQDERFAPALYQHGLVLFRKGDVAGATSSLETYLKLAPNGEFAADALGLLKALKP